MNSSGRFEYIMRLVDPGYEEACREAGMLEWEKEHPFDKLMYEFVRNQKDAIHSKIDQQFFNQILGAP